MSTPIDLSYFQEKIGLLNRDIDHYARSSADLARTLVRLAITANEAAVKKELSIEWQPIETAPINEMVLILWGGQYICSALLGDDDGEEVWFEHDESVMDVNPTQWMPLP